jgi:uncharacterized protein YdiU (UPF0061 family)
MSDYRDLQISDTWNPFKGLSNPNTHLEDTGTNTKEIKELYDQYHKKLHVNCYPRLFPQTIFIVSSKSSAKLLKVKEETLSSRSNLPFLCGEKMHSRVYPFASWYSGHQYGEYSILGDGRTISLGRVEQYTIQIRGAGGSPLSEGKSGLVPLTRCVHEFIISEALAKLSIPTTLSLAVIGTPTATLDNRCTTLQPSGIITRFAQSWIRFGTFEYFYYRGELKLLKSLTDFVIMEYYPTVLSQEGQETLTSSRLITSDLYDKQQESINGGNLVVGDENVIESMLDNIGKPVVVPLNRYGIFFRRVMQKTADLVAHWQANGFVHGLMNTENMSIIGIGINYEESGFMDSYDPEFTPNSNDKKKRYQFERQPEMAKWALSRLGQTLAHLIGDTYTTGSARPQTRSSEEPSKTSKKHQSAMPPNRTIPMGFLFDSSKAENIVREILNEFEGLFEIKYGEIMCQVRKCLNRN